MGGSRGGHTIGGFPTTHLGNLKSQLQFIQGPGSGIDADTVDGKHASDLVWATDVVTVATANKILKLDANSKVPASITGNADGNAATATKLQTARTFAATGDASAPAVNFDGTGNVSLTLTLPTVNSNVGTFTKVTVNAKGQVTAASNITSYDITSTLGFTPVNKAGDTMSGLLTLAADPTTALQAVTKQFVDRKIVVQNQNGFKAATPIDTYTPSAVNIFKVNGTNDWVQNTGLVVTFSSKDTSSDNQVGTLYPGSIHQFFYAESGKSIWKRYAYASLAYSNISRWAGSTAVALNALYCPTTANDNGYYYKCTTAGTTASTEPTWTTGAGSTVTDGTAVWTLQGAFWSPWDKMLTNGTIVAADIPVLDWSKITTGKPTTLSGYGITDAVNISDVVTTATANKILRLDANGKLPTSITGDAITVSGYQSTAISVVRSDSVVTDWNTLILPGMYRVGVTNWTGASNFPSGAYAFGTLVVDTNNNTVTQTYYVHTGTSTRSVYTRTKWNASDWTPWSGILTDTKMGSGSGIDADMVDGVHLSGLIQTSDVVTVATANKILRLDSNGKLPSHITGNADGNAGTATKLQNIRTISLTGDVSGSFTFDGSGDVTFTTTYKDSGVTAGTYTKVTTDAKGNITAGASLVATDIPVLDWSKITTGIPTTISGYGITDAVNVSDVVTTATANKILRLDANSKLPASITGNADGNAATATKLASSRTFTLTGAATGSASFDGSANASIAVTVVDDSHKHTYLKTRGAVTAETGTSTPAQNGLSLSEAYNNGYPTTYGNVMTLYGQGSSQLLLGWSGTSATDGVTQGTSADNYIRSKRDTGASTWSAWAKIWTDQNFTPSSKLDATANAVSASKWATTRTVTLTGDVTGSFSIDGTGNVSFATAYKNSGVTAGTYTKVTTDARGVVTAGASLVAADIPALDWSKITTGIPTTLGGYGITDAVNSSDVVTTATANKILRLDVNAKLPAHITGNADGNAATATKLQTARTFSWTGDVTGSLTFDGTGNVSSALTLANSGVTSGTYTKVTVNAKGLVTAGSNPTTLGGYGITDALNLNGGTMTGNIAMNNGSYVITSNPGETGGFSSDLKLDWFNNAARIRIGGAGVGSQAEFTIQGTGDVVRFGVDGSGNGRFTGALTVAGDITMNNKSINNIAYLNGQYGLMMRSSDEWLRINDDGSHTSGTYFGTTIARTDGTFQVGNAGGTASINSSGFVYNGALARIKTTTNAVAGFQVQNSSAGTILSVDTVNNRVGINGSTPSFPLEVNGIISNNNAYIRSYQYSTSDHNFLAYNIVPKTSVTGHFNYYASTSRNYKTNSSIYLDMAAVSVDKAFYYNGSTYTDVTTNIKSSTVTSPITLLAATTDYFYLGDATKITEVYVDLTTFGTGITLLVEYWNGTGWTALTVTDGTTNLTADGWISWTSPADWATNTVSDATARYYIRLSTTTTPTVIPKIDYLDNSVFTGEFLSAYNANTKVAFINRAGDYSGRVLISTVAQGTAPLTITSNTQVNNLNADYLDGLHATSFVRTDAATTVNYPVTFAGSSPDNLIINQGGGYAGVRFNSSVNAGSDFGYIRYYNDVYTFDSSYDPNSGAGENSALVIGVENDKNTTSGDMLVLRSAYKLIIDNKTFADAGGPSSIVEFRNSGTVVSSINLSGNYVGDVTGNAGTATKLATARTVTLNGDVTGSFTFDGSGNVSFTTAYKASGVTAGTYTKVTTDAKGNITAGTSLAASDIPVLDWSKITTGVPTTISGYGITDAVNVSDVVTTATSNKLLRLDANSKLPASITGNADGNAATATQWATARTVTLGGDVTGSVTIDGTSDQTLTVTVLDDSHNHSNYTPFSTITATTPATAGWYRIATSAVGIGANSGIFKVNFSGTGVKGRALLASSCHDGVVSGSAVGQLGFTSSDLTLGMTQARVVYNTTAAGNYAYVEVYNPTALAITYTVDILDATGWTLVSPSTAGSIPVGYTSQTITLDIGLVSGGDVTASRQLISLAATGTAPLSVTSTTAVTNLNADMVDGLHASDFLGVSANAVSATKLVTARTITIAGDTTASATSFDGTANITLTTTLANSGVTAGTYKSVTVDTKGRVTAGTNPTTLGGYGITDALNLAGGTLTGGLILSNAGVRPQLSGKNGSDAISTYPQGITYQTLAGTETGFPSTTGVLVTFYESIYRNFQLFQLKNNNTLYMRTWSDLTSNWTSWSTFIMSDDIVSAPASNKILKLDGNGKLPGSITGNADGNAATSTKLQTARNITVAGDTTAPSVSFDGTADLTITTTLANSGVTAGTYTKVTVDAKGRVTSGTSMSSSDVTTSLGYTPVNKAGDTLAGTLNLDATSSERQFKFTGTGINWGFFGNTNGMGWYDWQNTRSILSYNPTTNTLNVGNLTFQHNGFNVWDSNNDGAGSGMDADLLDGLHGSSFMRTDANTTTTGNIYINNHSMGGTPTIALAVGDTDTGLHSTTDGVLQIYANNVSHATITGTSSTFNITSTNLQHNGNKVWDAGNHGPGSTLNADLVDGLHASSFMRSDADTSTTGALTTGGGLTVGGILKCSANAWKLTFNPGEIRKTIAHNFGTANYVTTTGTNSSARHANWDNPTTTTIDIVLDSPYYDSAIAVDVIFMLF